MNIIKVKEIISNGLSENDGLLIRKKIQDLLKQSEEKIILDFSEINLFATPFFNSFIGYFVIQYNPEKVSELIELINISELGKETYQHSFNNAKNFYQKNINTDNIGTIVANNIKNS